MKILAPHDGPDIAPVETSGGLETDTIWVMTVVLGTILLALCVGIACWIVRFKSSLSHKLGSKRCPDKALVFQPPRRATAVRSPGSATHYLRKSPSPTAPAPPAATSPPQPQPPTQNSVKSEKASSASNSPNTPTAPTEPTPLSKELADVHATEKTKPTEPETNDGRLGDLHFKLRYENEKNALVVSVVSCQNLPGREPAGPDPYVKLQLLPDKQHKVKTRVVRKTRCPVYDEDFTFYGIAPHQIAGITLHFVVLSFDRYSRDEIIGEVVSPLSNLQLQSGEAMALCREIQPRSLKMRSAGRGEVLVSLCWQPAAARLTVVLLKARNLPRMDLTGLADPYAHTHTTPADTNRCMPQLDYRNTILKCHLFPSGRKVATFVPLR
ncbi:synaptotagmin-4-like [Bombyx mandarina]|uniref:Synaptotagmin-4-like n=1 Tax=Bombyx mandarina TaxID=7092 RepID=A0A6J2KGE4_BOMMA|nr:synaptotagmin-4-like [Bombyx mandarina]